MFIPSNDKIRSPKTEFLTNNFDFRVWLESEPPTRLSSTSTPFLLINHHDSRAQWDGWEVSNNTENSDAIGTEKSENPTKNSINTDLYEWVDYQWSNKRMH